LYLSIFEQPASRVFFGIPLSGLQLTHGSLAKRGVHISAEKQKHFSLIPGFHAVKESLVKTPERLLEVWVGADRKGARAEEIASLGAQKGVPVLFKDLREIEALVPGATHQSFVALAEGFTYTGLEDLIEKSRREPGSALLIVADHITDEGNLGALIRTAAFFGVHGLILPKDRSAKITGKLLKRTSGAYASLPISQVVNIARTLGLLAQKGFWIIGAAGEAQESIFHFDWDRDVVLVLGSESRGLSRSVRDQCHALVKIPGSGQVESLNLSVAGGVILSEIVRQRGSKETS
jgi:23S rRNA (guanosine2251-2'-O)-methyltransferase